jgi:hypothetical protein
LMGSASFGVDQQFDSGATGELEPRFHLSGRHF